MLAPSDGYIPGVAGVMEAYKTSLLHVGLSGPTNCAPMIRHVSRLAITAAQSRTAQVEGCYVFKISRCGVFCTNCLRSSFSAAAMIWLFQNID